MGRILTTVAIVTSLWVAQEATARGPAARARRDRSLQRAELERRESVPLGPTRPSAARYDAGRYPKFQGGFHSRELQNLGVPTGDTGLRGNGFSMYPW